MGVFGATMSYATSTGSFSAPGGTLEFDGYHNLTALSTIDADRVNFLGGSSTVAGQYDAHIATDISGTVSFTGAVEGVGALTVSGVSDFSQANGNPVTLTLSSLDINDGFLQGTDNFVVDGLFTWHSGRLLGPSGSSLTSEDGIKMIGDTGDGYMFLQGGRSLFNEGQAVWSGGTFQFTDGSPFVNAAGATFDDQTDGYFGDRNEAAGASTFYNQGTLVKSAGAANNDASFDLTFDNTGSVTAQSGLLDFSGGYLQSAGSTSLAGGELGGELNVQGGVLTGSGTIFGDVTNGGGEVSPGSPLVVLEIKGNYSQSAPGGLQVLLDGLTPGTQSSELQGDHSITLGGTLSIAFAAGFTPSNGNQFTIIDNQGSSPVNGTFTGLSEGTVFQNQFGVWRISYHGGDGNDVVLTYLGHGPETYAVTDAGDYSQQSPGIDPTDTNGGVSLRSAIAAANFDAVYGVSDTITFNPSLNGSTLFLTQGALGLTAGSGITTIQGGNQITIDGGNLSQVFQVDTGATLSISGLTLRGGSGGDGGGISNYGTLTVSNSTFSGNSATLGGGIYNAGTLTVSNSTLSGNSAAGAGGSIENVGTLTVLASTISGNSAQDGAGIVNTLYGVLTVSNSTFTGNSARGTFSQGGAIFNNSTLTVSNSTFSGNSSSYAGGGIYNENPSTLMLSNSTFAGNSAGWGGGIFSNGSSPNSLILQNTIVAGNTAIYGGPDIYGSITTDNGYNLLGTGVNNSSTDPRPGPDDLFSDSPLLAPLGNYGGPTKQRTHHDRQHVRQPTLRPSDRQQSAGAHRWRSGHIPRTGERPQCQPCS
jgi:hypothetical protein